MSPETSNRELENDFEAETDDDEEGILPEREAKGCRTLAARANHLAMDRPDIQFVV